VSKKIQNQGEQNSKEGFPKQMFCMKGDFKRGSFPKQELNKILKVMSQIRNNLEPWRR
jgi:hypothetical protein